jgi:hypothetical protein
MFVPCEYTFGYCTIVGIQDAIKSHDRGMFMVRTAVNYTSATNTF